LFYTELKQKKSCPIEAAELISTININPFLKARRCMIISESHHDDAIGNPLNTIDWNTTDCASVGIVIIIQQKL